MLAGFQDGAVLRAELHATKKVFILREPMGTNVADGYAITASRSHVLIGDAKMSVLWAPLWAGE